MKCSSRTVLSFQSLAYIAYICVLSNYLPNFGRRLSPDADPDPATRIVLRMWCLQLIPTVSSKLEIAPEVSGDT